MESKCELDDGSQSTTESEYYDIDDTEDEYYGIDDIEDEAPLIEDQDTRSSALESRSSGHGRAHAAPEETESVLISPEKQLDHLCDLNRNGNDEQSEENAETREPTSKHAIVPERRCLCCQTELPTAPLTAASDGQLIQCVCCKTYYGKDCFSVKHRSSSCLVRRCLACMRGINAGIIYHKLVCAPEFEGLIDEDKRLRSKKFLNQWNENLRKKEFARVSKQQRQGIKKQKRKAQQAVIQEKKKGKAQEQKRRRGTTGSSSKSKGPPITRSRAKLEKSISAVKKIKEQRV